MLLDAMLVYQGADPLYGINAGLVALTANLLTAGALTWPRPANTPDNRLAVPEPALVAPRPS